MQRITGYLHHVSAPKRTQQRAATEELLSTSCMHMDAYAHRRQRTDNMADYNQDVPGHRWPVKFKSRQTTNRSVA